MKMLTGLILSFGLSGLARGAPVVRFTDTSLHAPEGIGTIAIPVELSEPAAVPVLVTLAYEPVSAEADSDYRHQPRTITIPAGETAWPAPVILIDDSRVETNELFRLRLTAASGGGASLGSPAAVLFYIIDDDQAQETPVTPPPPGEDPPPGGGPPPPSSALTTASFAASQSRTTEGGATLHVALNLNQITNVPVTVTIARTDLTTSPGDASLAATQILFPTGKTTAEVVLNINNDTTVELEEQLRLAITGISPASVLAGAVTTQTVTIVDNDLPEVFLDPLSGTTAEADEAQVAVRVRLSKPSPRPVTVVVGIGGTATPGGQDFQLDVTGLADISEDSSTTPITIPNAPRPLLRKTLTFASNEVERVISWRVIDDKKDEEDETVDVLLVSTSQATLRPSAVRSVQTITDDDLPTPDIGFARKRSFLPEGEAVNIVAALSAVHDLPVSFELEVSGTAGPGDYALPPPPYVIAAGQTGLTLRVEVSDDARREADETFQLVLASPTNANPGEITTYTHWIVDNDAERQNLVFFVHEGAAAEADRVLTTIGPRTGGVVPRGLALDARGNRYVTDWGNGLAGEGGIFFVAADSREAIRLVSGLTRPGDIEMLPSGRGLVLTEQGGRVRRIGFGISILLTNRDPFGSGTSVHLKTLNPIPPAKVSADGWFHFLNLSDNAVFNEESVGVVIESGGRTKVLQDVPLGTGDPAAGHTFLRVEF